MTDNGIGLHSLLRAAATEVSCGDSTLSTSP